MQYCPKCKVNVRGHKRCCPLCEGPLTGEPEEDIFPVLPLPRWSSLSFIKISSFIAVTLIVIMSAVILISDEPAHWCTIMILATILVWADLLIALYFRNNFIKLITTQTWIGMAALVVIDLMTGRHGWSVTWSIPFIFLGLTLLTIIIGKAAKLALEDYIIYLTFDVLFSLLQLIPIHTELNRQPIPAVTSMSILVVFAAGVLIFRFSDLKAAYEKWLNL